MSRNLPPKGDNIGDQEVGLARFFALPKAILADLAEIASATEAGINASPEFGKKVRCADESIRAAIAYEFYRLHRQKQLSAGETAIAELPAPLREVLVDPESLAILSVMMVREGLAEKSALIPLTEFWEESALPKRTADVGILPGLVAAIRHPKKGRRISSDVRNVARKLGVELAKTLQSEINSQVMVGSRAYWEIPRPGFMEESGADEMVFLCRLSFLLGHCLDMKLFDVAELVNDICSFVQLTHVPVFKKFNHAFSLEIQADSVRKKMVDVTPWVVEHMHCDYAHLLKWKDLKFFFDEGKTIRFLLPHFVSGVLGSYLILCRQSDKRAMFFLPESKEWARELVSKGRGKARRIANMSRRGIGQPIRVYGKPAARLVAYPYMKEVLPRKALRRIEFQEHVYTSWDEKRQFIPRKRRLPK